MVARWRPNFRPSSDTITTTMVWVRFPEILIELFNEQVLLQIGNKLGKAIRIDKTTLTVTRGKFARVCVQLDLRKSLTPYISPLGYLQKVEYEELHVICFECGGYGHRRDACSKLVKHRSSMAGGNLDAPGTMMTPRLETSKKEEGLYGHWMFSK